MEQKILAGLGIGCQSGRLESSLSLFKCLKDACNFSESNRIVKFTLAYTRSLPGFLEWQPFCKCLCTGKFSAYAIFLMRNWNALSHALTASCIRLWLHVLGPFIKSTTLLSRLPHPWDVLLKNQWLNKWVEPALSLKLLAVLLESAPFSDYLCLLMNPFSMMKRVNLISNSFYNIK